MEGNHNKSVLVVGAGIQAPLDLAEQGFEVYLAEREETLGGNLKNIYYTIDGNDVQGYLNSLIKELEGNPRIKLYTGTSIDSIEGYIGNYKTWLSVNGSGPAMSTEIECGDHSNWGSGIETKRVPLWRLSLIHI